MAVSPSPVPPGGRAVVSAMHLHLEERVAIKFLLPELAQDPALVVRFLREGRMNVYAGEGRLGG